MRSGPSSLLLAPVERSIQFLLDFPCNASGRLDVILARISWRLRQKETRRRLRGGSVFDLRNCSLKQSIAPGIGLSDSPMYNSNHLKGVRPELNRFNLVL